MTSRCKVVVTSGGFDPLHVGHIRCLKDAKKIGDFLIVILNSDTFLLSKKGFVFMPYEERKEILKSIKYVDSVMDCVDKDQSVCETLRMFHKENGNDCDMIFAKGGDKTLENIPEVNVCKELNIMMIFGVGGSKVQSSSDLIKKIKGEENGNK